MVWTYSVLLYPLPAQSYQHTQPAQFADFWMAKQHETLLVTTFCGYQVPDKLVTQHESLKLYISISEGSAPQFPEVQIGKTDDTRADFIFRGDKDSLYT